MSRLLIDINIVCRDGNRFAPRNRFVGGYKPIFFKKNCATAAAALRHARLAAGGRGPSAAAHRHGRPHSRPIGRRTPPRAAAPTPLGRCGRSRAAAGGRAGASPAAVGGHACALPRRKFVVCFERERIRRYILIFLIFWLHNVKSQVRKSHGFRIKFVRTEFLGLKPTNSPLTYHTTHTSFLM